MRKISIVHIADIHARENEDIELSKRVDALIADIRKMSIFPDVLVVSGDLAFSGKETEYSIVERNMLGKITAKLNVPPERIVLCIGNHDIERNKVDKYFADGVIGQLISHANDTSVLGESVRYKDMEGNYRQFSRKYTESQDPTYSKQVTVEGLKVGFAALNTARTCFAYDDTKNKLFLDDAELNQRLTEVSDSGLKIAVMHHPISWLNEGQKERVVADLTQGFDMVLTGHLHEVDASSVVKPSARFIAASVSSFYEGTAQSAGRYDGYNIYEISPSDKKCKVYFRKYVRSRNQFAQDVDQAENGECEFLMPDSAFVSQPSYNAYEVAHHIQSTLAVEVSDNLKQIQRIDHPVYVSPTVFSVNFEASGARRTSRLQDGAENFKRLNVIYAPADVGSTLYLKCKCQSAIDKGDVAFYLDAQKFDKILTKENLVKYISVEYDLKKEYIELDGAYVYIDNVGFNAQTLLDCCKDESPNTSFCLCVKDEFAFEALSRGNKEEDVAFYEFRYWGPAKLREFIGKFVAATGVKIENLEAASEFIINSLAISDIPVTPFLVAVYIRIFCECSGMLGSLPVLELLEQIESRCFMADNGAGLKSRYWSRKFLMRLALKCYHLHKFEIEKQAMIDDFATAIREMGLDGNIDQLVKRLKDAGLIVENKNYIAFSCYTFMRYYLSFAFEDMQVGLPELLKCPEEATSIGDSAAYYVARHRGDKSISDKLFATVAENFKGDPRVTLAELEEYAKGLLTPVQEDNAADEAIDVIERSKSTEDKQDQRFHEHKEAIRQSEQDSLEANDKKLLPIAQDIALLRMTYHVFRNAEEFSISEKKKMLNQILDFHLCCNMRLVRFFSGLTRRIRDVSSLFAYMITLGGTSFLSYNVGAWSLKKAIRELYEETSDELRRFLLICIKADMGMYEYVSELVDLLERTDSIALMEMGYFRIREGLVKYNKERIPADLIAAFNKIHKIRNATARSLEYFKLAQNFDQELVEIRRLHLEYLKDKLAGREV